MVDLGAIGFGLEPQARIKAQGEHLARASFPYMREGIITAREGRVKWEDNTWDLLRATLEGYAPIIDESDLEESEKLMLHAIFAFVQRTMLGGLMNEKKLKMVVACIDILVEMYGEGASIIHLEVDRSGE